MLFGSGAEAVIVRKVSRSRSSALTLAVFGRSFQHMSKPLRQRIAFIVHVGSVLLFLICLFLPAFDILSPHADRSPYIGLAALALGVIGHTSSWLANPFLFFAWFSLGRAKGVTSFVSALIAFSLALTFLGGGQLAAGSEGLYPYRILSGYFVWLGAIALAAIAGLLYGNLSVGKIDETPTLPDHGTNEV